MEAVIKTFTTPKGYYLYDRNTNSILNINADEYEAINNENHLKHETVLKALQSKGYCLKGRLRAIEHPDSKTLEYHLKNRIEQITMQVTQNCNLRCEYCTYSGNYNQRTHTNKVMDLKTMYKCVDFIMKHSRDMDKIAIGFYGGEPLLMINNIKKCVKYIKENYPERDIHYTLTTNGTLLSDEIVSFFQENDFHILISLDGPAYIHDIHRKFADGTGSFETIIQNVEHIKEVFPNYYKNIGFNAVINPGTEYKCVKDFYDAETVLRDTIIRTTTVNPLGTKNNIIYYDDYYITYRYEMMKLIMYALGMIKLESVSKLFYGSLTQVNRMRESMNTISELTEYAHHGGPCVPGARRLFIDTEGCFYPCERVSEASDVMRIGHIDKGFDLKKASALINIGQITEDECLKCWNLLYCGMCASFADDNGKLSRNCKLSNCENMKANTLDTMKTLCLFKEMGIDSTEVQFNENSGDISV